MGFRTVVIINNDRLDAIQDPVLKDAVLGWWSRGNQPIRWAGPYNVVEQCHADVVSLLKVDSLQATLMASDNGWYLEDNGLRLLKDAADKLGYRLVRKSNKA